ncbi:aspartate/glutamate racemase family protein [Paenibacillus yanchengensis]|uniref:Aspartate/glutamate racemase family protein n=1 Tax=Paenibacillus yanchengensis TaxID=2035833 RepID=A0ABW4YQZ6_9BACL
MNQIMHGSQQNIQKMDKVVGILGGMGPKATVDFMSKIIEQTRVITEQDHLRMLVYNNPKIPSRIDAFKPENPSPLPELIRTAVTLEQGGADYIMIPCHSAHYWLDELQQSISIPIYSIVACTIENIQLRHDLEKILLIATETTLRSGLYQQAFSKLPVQLLLPAPNEQVLIQHIIHMIKTNSNSLYNGIIDLRDMLNEYKKKSVHTAIAGCTEIPLILTHLDHDFEFIDPSLLLARKAVELSLST